MIATTQLGKMYRAYQSVANPGLRKPLVKMWGRNPVNSAGIFTASRSSQLSNHSLSRAIISTTRRKPVASPVFQRKVEIFPSSVMIPRCTIYISKCNMDAEGKPPTASQENQIIRIPSPSQPPMPPRRRPPKKVTNFLFQKFLNFVQGYQEMMQKRFPAAMNVYRVFVVGFKDFSKELAEYVKIKTKALLSSDGVLRLNREELDIYYRMPSEIMKVGPTLLLSALPGFQYIIFPIAYKFPKRLLSTHFWSLQQKSQFAIEIQRKRLFNQRPVLRHLQSHLDSIRDERLREICRDVLFKLGSGSQPTMREIMKIKPLFESEPFSIRAMHGPHIKSLCRLHGIHTLCFCRSRIYDRAEMLYVMDLSLIREGIFTLKPEELRQACFLRGLNASNTSQEDMVEFLQQWASISSSIQPHSYSLLVHLPVLLAYNNPNNWALLS